MDRRGRRRGRRIRNGHLDYRVALRLWLVPRTAARIISVAGVRIGRAAGSGKRIIGAAIGCGRQPGDGADRNTSANRIVAPAVPAAVAITAAITVADVDAV